MRKPASCIEKSNGTDLLCGNTIDLEMLARTLFSLIFANSFSSKFKVFTNIENTCFQRAILNN